VARNPQSGQSVALGGKRRSLDSFDGGSGIDTLFGSVGADAIFLDDASADATAAIQSSARIQNIEKIQAGAGDDLVNLTSNRFSLGDITVDAGDGNDVVWSSAGNDTLLGGAGNDSLDGGAGNDTLSGGTGTDELYGGAGDDLLQISVDSLYGVGASTIQAGSPGHAGSRVSFALLGQNQSWDFFDGGSGLDSLQGSSTDDVIILDDAPNSSTGGTSRPRLISIERINTGAGNDVVNLTSTRMAYADVVIDGGAGNDVLWSSSGNDYLVGAAGNDNLDANWGNDILDGGIGDDSLSDLGGNNVLLGGAGNDSIQTDAGHNLIAGGSGNDSIKTGNGKNIIAFNRGDGADTVITSSASRNTISFGKGIAYADLNLSRSGDDLILDAGSGDALTFKNWYLGCSNRTTEKLQFFKEGSSDYDPNSCDRTLNRKVESFEFCELVQAADANRATKPSALQAVTRWNLSHGLMTAFLSSSNSAALGGDLAYQFSQTGNLAGNWLSSSQSTLASAQFGDAAQSLQKPLGGASSNDLKLMA
jgi:Ca2+-binding RTX toxin-like protein